MNLNFFIRALALHFSVFERQSSAKPLQYLISLKENSVNCRRWVKAKTVTVALSDQQAELFRRAIDDHRKLEKLIDQMRALSQQVLLNSVEGPARRKRRISS